MTQKKLENNGYMTSAKVTLLAKISPSKIKATSKASTFAASV